MLVPMIDLSNTRYLQIVVLFRDPSALVWLLLTPRSCRNAVPLEPINIRDL